jgi:hypothetical protein
MAVVAGMAATVRLAGKEGKAAMASSGKAVMVDVAVMAAALARPGEQVVMAALALAGVVTLANSVVREAREVVVERADQVVSFV